MLAVRPPDYFPPFAHAALLARATHVVVADTFAFSRQAHHNRARLLTSQGPQWVTVPRRHAPVGTPLGAVGVVDDGWAARHVRALRSAYGMAPFLEALLPEVEALLAGPHPSLGALAAATTEWTARRVGSAAETVRASALPGAPATLAGVWEVLGRPDVLALPDTAGPDRARLGPLGGRVRVLAVAERPRRHVWPGGGGGLSALDLLLTYGPDAGRVLAEGVGAETGDPGAA